jgi:hypothetical protein
MADNEDFANDGEGGLDDDDPFFLTKDDDDVPASSSPPAPASDPVPAPASSSSSAIKLPSISKPASIRTYTLLSLPPPLVSRDYALIEATYVTFLTRYYQTRREFHVSLGLCKDILSRLTLARQEEASLIDLYALLYTQEKLKAEREPLFLEFRNAWIELNSFRQKNATIEHPLLFGRRTFILKTLPNLAHFENQSGISIIISSIYLMSPFFVNFYQKKDSISINSDYFIDQTLHSLFSFVCRDEIITDAHLNVLISTVSTYCSGFPVDINALTFEKVLNALIPRTREIYLHRLVLYHLESDLHSNQESPINMKTKTCEFLLIRFAGHSLTFPSNSSLSESLTILFNFNDSLKIYQFSIKSIICEENVGAFIATTSTEGILECVHILKGDSFKCESVRLHKKPLYALLKNDDFIKEEDDNVSINEEKVEKIEKDE